MSASRLSAFFTGETLELVAASFTIVASESCGEIKNGEAFDARTGKPERNGLYCARVFGPVEDSRCLCGKYASPEFTGTTCEKCGVPCGSSESRNSRWGHIELPTAVFHPRLFDEVAVLLGCGKRDFKKVLRGTANLREDGTVVELGEWDAA